MLNGTQNAAMKKPSQTDIAAFPELFEGIDEFFTETFEHLKRTSAALACAATAAGMLLAWVAQRAA